MDVEDSNVTTCRRKNKRTHLIKKNGRGRRDVTMRRRHKAQYAAHERAHLASSMPEGPPFTRSSPKPRAAHLGAPEEEKVRTVFCIIDDFVAL